METPFLPVSALITNTGHHSVSHHMTHVTNIMVDSVMRCSQSCTQGYVLPIVTCFSKTAAASPKTPAPHDARQCAIFSGNSRFFPTFCFWFQCLWWWKIDLQGGICFIYPSGVFFGKSPQAAGLGHTEISAARQRIWAHPLISKLFCNQAQGAKGWKE